MGKRIRITLDFECEHNNASEEELAKNLLFDTSDNYSGTLISVDTDIEGKINANNLEFKVEVYDSNTGRKSFTDKSSSYDEFITLRDEETDKMEELRDEGWHNQNCL